MVASPGFAQVAAQVAFQKVGKLGKGQLHLALLALKLFLMASCLDMWLSEWEFLIYDLFFSHFREPRGNEILSFHQFECFGLQCADKTGEENTHGYFQ